MAVEDDYFLSKAIHGDFEPVVTKLDGLKGLEDVIDHSLTIASNCALMIGTIRSVLNLSDEDSAELATLAGEQIEAMLAISQIITPLKAKLVQLEQK